MNHIISSVEFIHADHVILQLILYKLWSKTLLWAFQPHELLIMRSQLHPAQRDTPKIVSQYYLIFRNKWDIEHFLFLANFSYHREMLYKPLCLLCWVNFIHAGHVILQLILYKLWSKMLLQALEPYKLPFMTSQLHPAQRDIPKKCHTTTYI